MVVQRTKHGLSCSPVLIPYIAVSSLLFLLTTAWWDIFMDWSLMQPHAPYPFLRPDLGYEEIWVFPASFDLTKDILLCNNNRPTNAFVMVILCCVSRANAT